MAGSAEWVAGSAVKLGIFSDFWRGASARAKNRKKCFKQFGGILAEIWLNFGGILVRQAMSLGSYVFVLAMFLDSLLIDFLKENRSPRNCLRFANPAEATWDLRISKLELCTLRFPSGHQSPQSFGRI